MEYLNHKAKCRINNERIMSYDVTIEFYDAPRKIIIECFNLTHQEYTSIKSFLDMGEVTATKDGNNYVLRYET